MAVTFFSDKKIYELIWGFNSKRVLLFADWFDFDGISLFLDQLSISSLFALVRFTVQ